MPDTPADAPSPQPDTPRDSGGLTIDLSSGVTPGTRPRKKKGPPPVVQQTINLSTKKEPTAESAVAPRSKKDSRGKRTHAGPKGKGHTKGSRGDKRGPKPTGTSLADLLDPDTLAKLKGK